MAIILNVIDHKPFIIIIQMTFAELVGDSQPQASQQVGKKGRKQLRCYKSNMETAVNAAKKRKQYAQMAKGHKT